MKRGRVFCNPVDQDSTTTSLVYLQCTQPQSAVQRSAVQCSAALMACLLAGESAHSATERPRVEVGVRLLRRHPLRRTLDTHLEGGGRGGEGGEEWEGRRGRGGEGGREEQRRAEVVMPQ